MAYSWDAQGNLTQRGDANQAGGCSVGGVAGKLCESFSYDALDRLDTVSRNGTPTLDLDYDLIGNLTYRSDLGSYTYHATKKHAVTTAGGTTYAYDANGNVSSRSGAALAWASFDLPLSITAGANASQFAYTPERARWRQVATTAGITETTHSVAGLLEKVSRPGQTLWKHYVATPTGLSALYIRRADGSADTYYLMRDHLGSTDQVLKAAGSSVVVAESFSALGARRGSDWSGAPSAADLSVIAATTAQGFTGHEMLDGVGLIHMHGRVYDPTMGRFLSVDPIVRDTAASQSWNGYGYVEGRMLSAIDPDGFETDPTCTTCVRPRADPPRSAWISSVYGTFHQRGEIRIGEFGLEELITEGYWSFSNPFGLIGLREPTLRSDDFAAPSELVSEDTVDVVPRDKGEKPGNNNPCNFAEMFTPGNKFPVRSPYGPRVNPITGEPGFHAGIDIGAPQGTIWQSPIDGDVAFAGLRGNGGGTVVVQGSGDFASYRVGGQHLSAIQVASGQDIRRGQPLGQTGGTPGTYGAGGSTGPHLHFYIRKDGEMMNPAQCYEKE